MIEKIKNNKHAIAKFVVRSVFMTCKFILAICFLIAKSIFLFLGSGGNGGKVEEHHRKW